MNDRCKNEISISFLFLLPRLYSDFVDRLCLLRWKLLLLLMMMVACVTQDCVGQRTPPAKKEFSISLAIFEEPNTMFVSKKDMLHRYQSIG
jgi:hypothetical protein